MAAASGEPVRSRWTATRYWERGIVKKDGKQGIEGKLFFFPGLSHSKLFARLCPSGALGGMSIPGATQILSPENSAKPRKPIVSPESPEGTSPRRHRNRLI